MSKFSLNPMDLTVETFVTSPADLPGGALYNFDAGTANCTQAGYTCADYNTCGTCLGTCKDTCGVPCPATAE
jgi:hypothetical protein